MGAKNKPKTEGSGRKKGTPNKANQDLMEKCLELKCDPFEVLLRFAANDWKGLGYDNECYFMEKPDGATKMGYTIPPELRQKAAKELCEYLYPKRKAVELSSSEDQGFKIIIDDYTKDKK